MRPSYHTLTIAETFSKLESSHSGLTDQEAERRLKVVGSNVLPVKRRENLGKIFFRQLKNPLTLLLILCVVLSYYLKDFANAIILIAVIITDVSVGFFQEYKASKSIASLLSFLIPQSIVLRGGERKTVDARFLVPGDIVLLSAGSKVPADLRLTQAYDLAVDESLLTGESTPVDKSTEQVADSDVPIADRVNMVFSGTVVVRGNCRGVVVATGMKTELGEIARETSATGIEESPLTKQFAIFSQKIGVLVGFGALIVFFLGLITGYSLDEIFQDVVAVSVAAIPEGLPLVVTAALAVTIQKMAKKKTIIRQLPAAETLGSCTVICTDKTGTLTKNEMTVKKLFDGKDTYDVSGVGYTSKGSIDYDGKTLSNNLPDRLQMLLTVGLLCNDSGISVTEGDVMVHGDPTEIAIILAAYKGGLLKENERLRYPKTGVLPFDSRRGFMATVHTFDGKQYIFVKGTPEKVALLCQLNEESVHSQVDNLAQGGMRVLAFAYKEVSGIGKLHDEDVKDGFEFLGLAGMVDPPRPEVKEAIASCQEAGIRVIMISGDHAVTSGTIAKEIGISSSDRKVITGYELSKMSDSELDEIINDVNVFARISPEQKLRIVSILKRRGEIVAVTGDGINDSPALQTAHIGVALGKRGTDVAKDVADMVILDDNFATIVKAIEEARILFANIQKATMFLLPTGFSAIITVVATMILKVPAPFTAVQLLWINLVTSGLQDVALAFEPGEKGILRRKPRKQSSGIMSRLLYERSLLVAITIALGVLFIYLLSRRMGESVAYSRTLATTTMVIFQFFQVWNSRSETRSIFQTPALSNPMLFITMILAVFAQVAALLLPPLRSFLETTTISFTALTASIIVASSVILVVEADKFFRRARYH